MAAASNANVSTNANVPAPKPIEDMSIEEIIEISKAKSVDPIAIKNTVDHYMVSKGSINSLINSPYVKMNDKKYERLISQIPYRLVANIIFDISDIGDDPAEYKPTLLRTLPGLYYLFRKYDIDINKRFKYDYVELSLLERAKESNQKDLIDILESEQVRRRRRGNILRGYEFGEKDSMNNSKTGGRRKRSTRRRQRRTRSKTHYKRRQTRRKK